MYGEGFKEEVEGSRAQVGSREFSFNREDSFMRPFSTEIGFLLFHRLCARELGVQRRAEHGHSLQEVGSGKKQSPQIPRWALG